MLMEGCKFESKGPKQNPWLTCCRTVWAPLHPPVLYEGWGGSVRDNKHNKNHTCRFIHVLSICIFIADLGLTTT